MGVTSSIAPLSVLRAATTTTTLAAVLAAAALTVSGAVLALGWGAGMEGVARLHPSYPAMVPVTAAALAVAAIGCLLRGARAPVWAPMITGGAIIVMLLARMNLVLPDAPGGRGDAMSLGTQAALWLLAGGLLTPDRGQIGGRTGGLVGVVLATAGLAVVTVPLLGYLFDSAVLFNNPVFTKMAPHTAILLAALFVCLLLARPDLGWLSIVLARERGGEMARKLLPVVVLAPVALCGLALAATHANILNADFRLALLAFLMIVLTSTSVIVFAWVANRAEQNRAAMTEALRQSELARRESELAAAHAQKIEVLGQLVGGVAHDFNNVLAVIMGNLEMIEFGVDGDARKLCVQEAMDASGQAAHLTRQLLAFGRKSALRPVAIALDDGLEPSLAMFRRIAPPNITVELATGALGAWVSLDLVTFQQALLNLLINSRDAMPQGGRIRIATDRVALDAARADGFGGADPIGPGIYARVWVSDTGPGMDADTLARAQEPFFTTKEAGKGSGLGLTMVSGFCRRSGGASQIDSEVGHGVAVTLLFPCIAPPEPPERSVPTLTRQTRAV